MIGKSVSRIYDKDNNEFPPIYDFYPSLFDDVKEEQEQKEAERKTNLSIARFKQFAQLHNAIFIKKESSK